MTDGLTVSVDSTRAVAKLNAVPDAVRRSVRPAIVDLTAELLARVRAKLSGEVLNVRSGALLGSIHSDLVETPFNIIGRVFSDGSVPYARIHEYGGIINHPGSVARPGGVLHWVDPSGKDIFAKYTRPHPIPIPERSYLRSSRAEMQDKIVARLREAAQQGAREAAR